MEGSGRRRRKCWRCDKNRWSCCPCMRHYISITSSLCVYYFDCFSPCSPPPMLNSAHHVPHPTPLFFHAYTRAHARCFAAAMHRAPFTSLAIAYCTHNSVPTEYHMQSPQTAVFCCVSSHMCIRIAATSALVKMRYMILYR